MYAEMGMAKAIGNYYGSDKGKIGEMFSSAIDQLYEKGKVRLEKAFKASSFSSGNQQWTARQKDALDTSMNIADTFSNLDTSSKENMIKDFTSKLSATQSIVQNHCKQFGLSTSHVGLAGDIAGITQYFNSWMDKL